MSAVFMVIVDAESAVRGLLDLELYSTFSDVSMSMADVPAGWNLGWQSDHVATTRF
jgi:hypothetical protein